METEVTFNLKRLRESTSLDEQGDTSDEMIGDNCFNVNIIPDGGPGTSKERSIADKTKELIKEAEASRAHMYGTPGNQDKMLDNGVGDMVEQFLNSMRGQTMLQQHSALVDENYLVIGVHLDKG